MFHHLDLLSFDSYIVLSNMLFELCAELLPVCLTVDCFTEEPLYQPKEYPVLSHGNFHSVQMATGNVEVTRIAMLL